MGLIKICKKNEKLKEKDKRMNLFDENASKNWRIFMKCKILR